MDALRRLEEILDKSNGSKIKSTFWQKEVKSFQQIEDKNGMALKDRQMSFSEFHRPFNI